MIKIVLFTQHMLAGGIENALINFVKILPKDKYVVEVYLMEYSGEFIKKAENVCDLKIIPMDKKLLNIIPCGGIKVAIRKQLKNRRYLSVFIMLLHYIVGNHKFSELNINFNKIPQLNNQIDIAICYQLHSPFLVRYVAEKVVAKKKVGWMHNDFFTTQYDILSLKKYLNKYDYFFGNAEQIVKEFTNIIPEYKDNVNVIHSVIDKDYIMNQAKMKKVDEFDNSGKMLNMLTIARLENQKAIDRAVDACALLIKEKHPEFRWFIIGDGSEKPMIERKISDNHLQNYFILLGSKVNPYPYYASCDIYIQTSRHEGYATTITEAAMFGKTIVTTDVSGVSEQIVNGETGIVTGFSPNDIAKGVQKAFNKNVRIKIEKSLKCKQSNEENAIDIFEQSLNIQ